MIRNDRGFTLIELLIVIAMLGIFGVSFYQVRSLNNLAHKNHLFRQQAVWLLDSQAELIQVVPYAKLTVGDELPFFEPYMNYMGLRGGYGRRQVQKVSPTLKKVFLEFQWKDARNQKQKLTLTLYMHRTG